MTDHSALEWTVVTETREFSLDDGKVLPYQIKSLLRSDGMRVERLGVSREKEEKFLFTGYFGQFTLRASRWDEDTNQPTETYVVYLFSPYVKSDQQNSVRAISKDIESALLNYPPHNLFREVPLRQVVFQTEMSRNGSTIKQALDL